MNRLIDFYMGSGSDDNGRMLSEILDQDDNWLEATHDYIQWLFPNTEASSVTPWAPVITKGDEAIFKDNESLRNQLMASFRRILLFYGMEILESQIIKAANWDQRKSDWFTRDTHNNLRITRILKCLSTLGMEDEASQFNAALKNLVESEIDCGISPVTIRYWSEAIAQ